MKFLFVALMLFSFSVFADNVVTNPSAEQVIVPTADVPGLTVDLYSGPATTSDAIKGFANTGVGGVFGSNTNVGLSAASAEGPVADFFPNNGDNANYIIGTWSGGGGGDRFAGFDYDGDLIVSIHDDGSLQLNMMAQPEPTCDDSREGSQWYVHHTALVDGHMEFCQCDHSDVCAWH